MTPKQEKAKAMADSIMNTAKAIQNGIPEYMAALPPKRKNFFLKVWHWRSDKRKRKFAATKLVLPAIMGAMQIARIKSQPIPKYPHGGQ